VRSLDKVATRSGVDADALADALLKLEEGNDLTADEGRLITKAVDSLLPAVEEEPAVEEDTTDQGMLELKKLKLEKLLNRI
jgi:hypothetical protein